MGPLGLRWDLWVPQKTMAIRSIFPALMDKKNLSKLRLFLDEKVLLFNRPDFIALDPISIPHRFTRKEDIEISGLLTATISWGNRKSIITNANKMMDLMDHRPFEFVSHHKTADLKKLSKFVHRTFNGEDLIAYIQGLRLIVARLFQSAEFCGTRTNSY